MVFRLPTRCLNFCPPPETLASSPSKRPTFFRTTSDGVTVCKYVHRANRLELFGFRHHNAYTTTSLRGSCSISSDSFIHDQTSSKIQDISDDFSSENDCPVNGVGGGMIVPHRPKSTREEESWSSVSESGADMKPFECLEPSDWPERDEINLAFVERKLSSLEVPISLKTIQRKRQWQEGVKDIKESACTSVKKAFSSMVFIIQELHSCTLQMRELLFYEDLQGILGRAQMEIQASLVWLFQQVFSQTPSLMVSVMILLANYSVHSMANHASIAYTMLPQAYAATTESVSIVVDDQKSHEITVSSSTTSVGGGGGKSRPVASSTDGEGRFDRVSSYSIIPDGASSIQNPSIASEEEEEEESLSRELSKEGTRLWKSIKEEAAKMQDAVLRSEAINPEILKEFVSPVHVEIEADDYEVYSKTELVYRIGLAQEPNNSLLLTNYAQFLFLVIRDYDRAEHYFKRAVKAKPKDAEAMYKYAKFLRLVRKDMWGAEQAYLEAIDTDPSNSHYVGNYAEFLWHTGGEGTCLAT